jgi:hypothetical protein
MNNFTRISVLLVCWIFLSANAGCAINAATQIAPGVIELTAKGLKGAYNVYQRKFNSDASKSTNTSPKLTNASVTEVTDPSMLETNITTLRRTNACPNCWLYGADLREANLQRASLQGANLGEANLQGADLKSADLQRAKLQGANLQGADLYRANLKLAYLDPEGIRRARASGAINIPGTVVVEKKPKPKSKASPANNSSNNDIQSRLSKLKELEGAGLITKEEAATKRKTILDSL